jgi:hypothetical protein
LLKTPCIGVKCLYLPSLAIGYLESPVSPIQEPHSLHSNSQTYIIELSPITHQGESGDAGMRCQHEPCVALSSLGLRVATFGLASVTQLPSNPTVCVDSHVYFLRRCHLLSINSNQFLLDTLFFASILSSLFPLACESHSYPTSLVTIFSYQNPPAFFHFDSLQILNRFNLGGSLAVSSQFSALSRSLADWSLNS